MYLSHNVRIGKHIVCRTLLWNTCKKCKKQGHTTSYCRLNRRFQPYKRRKLHVHNVYDKRVDVEERNELVEERNELVEEENDEIFSESGICI